MPNFEHPMLQGANPVPILLDTPASSCLDTVLFAHLFHLVLCPSNTSDVVAATPCACQQAVCQIDAGCMWAKNLFFSQGHWYSWGFGWRLASFKTTLANYMFALVRYKRRYKWKAAGLPRHKTVDWLRACELVWIRWHGWTQQSGRISLLRYWSWSLYKLASWLITFARASELPRIAKVSEWQGDGASRQRWAVQMYTRLSGCAIW